MAWFEELNPWVRLLLLGCGCVAALFAAIVAVSFCAGCLSPILKYWRVLRGAGALDREEAGMAYGLSRLLWRAAVLFAAAAVWLWCGMDLLDLRVAAAIAITLLGLGWYARDLGVRRMLSSLAANGFGPEHLR